MPDTDSKMMRHQQDLDTPQHIDDDETAAARDRGDSDPASAAARAATIGHASPAPENGQDAVLEQNRRSDYTREAEVFEDGRTDATPPLASKGRSRLGE